MAYTMVAVGIDEAHDAYEEVSRRAGDHSRAYDQIQGMMEKDHRAHFRKMKGRYVRTGSVKRSLTQPSGLGTVREVHGTSLQFGSSIFYAHFLTMSPYDRENEQVKKPSGDMRFAVLVLKRKTSERAGEIILNYLAEGFSVSKTGRRFYSKRDAGGRFSK